MTQRPAYLARLQETRPDPAKSLEVDSRAAAVGFEETTGRAVELGTIGPASTVSMNHLLGRQPKGWRVIDVTGSPAFLVRVSWDEKRITITHTGAAPTTPTIWIW